MSELEDDEALVDEAVKGEAFHFLRRCVVSSPHFHQEVGTRYGMLCVLVTVTTITCYVGV